MNKLSIIIPCYNCEKTLEESLSSCKRQNLNIPYEIIMVDDGSTDNTRNLIKKLAEGIENIKYFFHEENLGGGATRNTAVKNSTGDIIFCLDSDDILPDDTLPKMISMLENRQSDGVLFEYTKFFSGKVDSKNEIVKNVIENKPVHISDMFRPDKGFIVRVNFLYTKKAFDIVGGYPTHHGFDTQTFGFRFLSKGLKSYVCPDTFYLHRRNEKPSYFDREYATGKLSYNTYLMYEDILFLFSKKVIETILNFDILKRAKLGKDNLEKSIATLFNEIGEDDFFVKDYNDLLVVDGEKMYLEKIDKSTEPLDVFIKAVHEYKTKEFKDASYKFSEILPVFNKSLILRMNILRCNLSSSLAKNPDTVAYKEFNKKDIVFIMHNGGRLGNQLWTIAALHAYCLEKGHTFDIRCFFEYQQFFNIPIRNRPSKVLGAVYEFCENKLNIPENIRRDLFYGTFTLWSEIFSLFRKKYVLFDSDHKEQATLKIFIYKRYKTFTRLLVNTVKMILRKKTLPPYVYATKQSPELSLLPPSTKEDIFPENSKTTYFYGWLFRNPEGILKYQKEISRFLTPKKIFVERVEKQINQARQNFKNVIGVHIRLGDTVNEFMDNDRIAYSEDEVYKILREYLDKSGLRAQDTCFFICSDGKIRKENFVDMNLIITSNNPAEDMWLLSMTDTIIGADSSFAIMASLLGNKPFIVFRRAPLDWNYYKDKNSFFVNKYVKRFIY